MVQNYSTKLEDIVSSSKAAKQYFPRISNYILNVTSQGTPTKYCEAANYVCAMFFLHILNCLAEDNDCSYVIANKEFKKLVTKEILPDTYLKFKDGLVYSKSFKQFKFEVLIEDSALDVVIFSEKILKDANIGLINLDIYKNVVMKILQGQINDCVKDLDNITSSEYLEMAFMKTLIKAFNASKEISKLQDETNKLD